MAAYSLHIVNIYRAECLAYFLMETRDFLFLVMCQKTLVKITLFYKTLVKITLFYISGLFSAFGKQIIQQ